MTMGNGTHAVRALKINSYILLLSGFLIFLPYPLFFALKKILFAAGVRSFSPENAFMGFIIAGHMLLLVPLISIGVSALWVLRKTNSHDEKFFVFGRGFLRYGPALLLGVISLVVSVGSGNFFIPGIFGALLAVYACVLLKIDAKD